jgi:two-component system chemotaxis sensor kinase CheA
MAEDMSEFRDVFLEEANEQLDLLEQSILRLESEADDALIQSVFRAAHTLKGSSRAMGFIAMGDLTHAMEDVFDGLRRGGLTIASGLVDALFEAVDLLKQMVREVAEIGAPQSDCSHATARLRAALSGSPVPASQGAKPSGSSCGVEQKSAEQKSAEQKSAERTGTPALSEAALEAVRQTLSDGANVAVVTIVTATDCVMKSVRALMVLQALEQVGAVLASDPSADDIENERFDRSVSFVVATGGPLEELQAAATSVSEIVEATIAPWPDADAGSGGACGAAGADEGSRAEEKRAAASATAGAQPRIASADAAAAPNEGAGRPAHSGGMQATTVRVDVARLDRLLNLIGELVIDRTRIVRLGQRFELSYGGSELVASLSEVVAHITRISDDLQEEIMKARMLPIGTVFNRFPRMVRDLAQKLGKEVEFEMEGQETELDRSVVEVITDPLIHMLRNCLDHGIELPEDRERCGKPRTGVVRLSARHEENQIVLRISDDGKGMDPKRLRKAAVSKGLITEEAAERLSDRDALQLTFLPGFSTAASVSDISGRGVGMDIVRANLERLGADIDVESEPGRGTRIRVRMPLTLAIIRALLVRIAGSVFALPLASVVETCRIPADGVHRINNRESVVLRDRILPLVRLRSTFEIRCDDSRSEAAQESEARLYLVIVRYGEQQVGVIVDSLIGEQEIVIKTLGRFVGDVHGISGATILGDGHVALIVDVNGLVRIATGEKGKAYAA